MTVITTPTGNIGSKVLSNILSSNEPLRVLMRDPTKLSNDDRGKVEVIQGSLDNPEVVAKAMRGADQLFLIIPPSHTYQNVNDYYLNFSKIICTAIKNENINRVVYISGTGLGFDKNAGPVSASFLVEQQLKNTEVNLRILHCGTFMENLFHSVTPIQMRAQFGTTVPADVKCPWVATQDIANIASELLKDKSWRGQSSVGVLGPKDISYGEIAKVISEVLKKEISYAVIPPEPYKAMLQQFGSSEAAAVGLIEIYSSMTKETFNRVERTAQTSTPTEFKDWCIKVLKPIIENQKIQQI